MTIGMISQGLQLTEEEAFALLNLAMTSPQKLDATSETAIRKLATFCSSVELGSNYQSPAKCELEQAG